MRITRLTRTTLRIVVSARSTTGGAETITGVDVALQDFDTPPNSATVWTAATYAAGVATVLIAGPDASPTSALVIPQEGAELWIRCVFGSEVEVTSVLRIVVEDTDV